MVRGEAAGNWALASRKCWSLGRKKDRREIRGKTRRRRAAMEETGRDKLTLQPSVTAFVS